MKTKRHILLYVVAAFWNLTVCWPAVLLIRLCWGENLRWRRNPDPKSGGGSSLWCDLKPDSWPARTWYRYKVTDAAGKKVVIELPEQLWARFGKWRTWGGTTLGHGGFFGPGRSSSTAWGHIEEHEDRHVEQFEASVLQGFWVGLYHAVVLIALGNVGWGLSMWLFNTWAGYLWMTSATVTAWLRGEDPYRGAHTEEAAYDAELRLGH